MVKFNICSISSTPAAFCIAWDTYVTCPRVLNRSRRHYLRQLKGIHEPRASRLGKTWLFGETIGTAVGYLSGNFSLDWGVYDLRARNEASEDPAWLSQHPGELAPYAICWFDHLPSGDSMIVRSPASCRLAERSDERLLPLAARGESLALHRDTCCGRLARRDERAYRQYSTPVRSGPTLCSFRMQRLSNAAGLSPRVASYIFSLRRCGGGCCGN